MTPKMLDALRLLDQRDERAVEFIAPCYPTWADPYTVFLNISTARALRKRRLVIWGDRPLEITPKARKILEAMGGTR